MWCRLFWFLNVLGFGWGVLFIGYFFIFFGWDLIGWWRLKWKGLIFCLRSVIFWLVSRVWWRVMYGCCSLWKWRIDCRWGVVERNVFLFLKFYGIVILNCWVSFWIIIIWRFWFFMSVKSIFGSWIGMSFVWVIGLMGFCCNLFFVCNVGGVFIIFYWI